MTRNPEQQTKECMSKDLSHQKIAHPSRAHSALPSELHAHFVVVLASRFVFVMGFA